LLNPFQRIGVASVASDVIDQNAGQLAVAVGLALRSFDL
jgi:Tfp pilus assembly PilM family ATPase